MLDRDQIAREVREEITREFQEHSQNDKEKKRRSFRQQNQYIQKGKTLFTGSSLMEQFPVTEFCLNEGLPLAYNRGIGITSWQMVCCWRRLAGSSVCQLSQNL